MRPKRLRLCLLLAALAAVAAGGRLAAQSDPTSGNAAVVGSGASLKAPTDREVYETMWGKLADDSATLDRQLSVLQARRSLIESETALANQRRAEDYAIGHRTAAAAWLGIGALIFLLGSGLIAVLLSRQLLTHEDLFTSASGEPAAIRLPLGLPDGSVRALLSIFVVVFGFAIVVLQEQLGLKNAEAITGFIGAVIAFYFASRGEAAVRESAAQAASATAKAEEAAKSAEAAHEVSQRAQAGAAEAQLAVRNVESTATAKAVEAAAAVTTPPAPGESAAAGAPVVDAQGRLKAVSARLEQLKGVLAVSANLDLGTGPLVSAQQMLEKVQQMLSVTGPLLSGRPSATEIAQAADQASALVAEIEPNEPITRTLSEAISTIGQAARVGGPIISGLTSVAGPVGLVAGILSAGVSLIAEKEKFDRLKAALTERPFDLGLLATIQFDGTVALAALDYATLFRTQLENAEGAVEPGVASKLLELFEVRAGEEPMPARDLAAAMRASPDAAISALAGKFSDPAALVDAIQEFRAALVTVAATAGLPATVAVSIEAPGAPATLPTADIVRAAVEARGSPAAAAALEQLVYVLEALGADPDQRMRLLDLFEEGLDRAMLVSTTNQAEVERLNAADAAAQGAS